MRVSFPQELMRLHMIYGESVSFEELVKKSENLKTA